MIEVRDFSRSYGAVRACENVSFTVPSGSFTVLLGKNGAGKSTLLKAICGVLPPDSGQIFVNGLNIAENPAAAKKSLGSVFEDAPLYDDMTVTEHLVFIASLHGMTRAETRDAVDRVIESCALGEYAVRRCKNLSRGTRQRVALAQALVHDPPAIILDEPMTGLDPVQTADVIALLKSKTETTFLFSTHIMHEIESLCTDIVILDRGMVIARGTKDDVLARANASSVEEAFLAIIPDKKGSAHA
jgi:ABC-2 type transport system ATP-binding protein